MFLPKVVRLHQKTNMRKSLIPSGWISWKNSSIYNMLRIKSQEQLASCNYRDEETTRIFKDWNLPTGKKWKSYESEGPLVYYIYDNPATPQESFRLSFPVQNYKYIRRFASPLKPI
jgi:hypothetical protein